MKGCGRNVKKYKDENGEEEKDGERKICQRREMKENSDDLRNEKVMKSYFELY